MGDIGEYGIRGELLVNTAGQPQSRCHGLTALIFICLCVNVAVLVEMNVVIIEIRNNAPAMVDKYVDDAIGDADATLTKSIEGAITHAITTAITHAIAKSTNNADLPALITKIQLLVDFACVRYPIACTNTTITL
jgi:hypothetical protein